MAGLTRLEAFFRQAGKAGIVQDFKSGKLGLNNLPGNVKNAWKNDETRKTMGRYATGMGVAAAGGVLAAQVGNTNNRTWSSLHAAGGGMVYGAGLVSAARRGDSSVLRQMVADENMRNIGIGALATGTTNLALGGNLGSGMTTGATFGSGYNIYKNSFKPNMAARKEASNAMVEKVKSRLGNKWKDSYESLARGRVNKNMDAQQVNAANDRMAPAMDALFGDPGRAKAKARAKAEARIMELNEKIGLARRAAAARKE